MLNFCKNNSFLKFKLSYLVFLISALRVAKELLGFWAKSEGQPLATELLIKKRVMNVPGSSAGSLFHSIDLIVHFTRLEFITLLFEEFLVKVV